MPLVCVILPFLCATATFEDISPVGPGQAVTPMALSILLRGVSNVKKQACLQDAAGAGAAAHARGVRDPAAGAGARAHTCRAGQGPGD